MGDAFLLESLHASSTDPLPQGFVKGYACVGTVSMRPAVQGLRTGRNCKVTPNIPCWDTICIFTYTQEFCSFSMSVIYSLLDFLTHLSYILLYLYCWSRSHTCIEREITWRITVYKVYKYNSFLFCLSYHLLYNHSEKKKNTEFPEKSISSCVCLHTGWSCRRNLYNSKCGAA